MSIHRLAYTVLVLMTPLQSLAGDTQLLWGDTHVHTYYSPDSYLNGNAGPDTAYRFARGLPVIHPSTRTRVQIETPLDFLVVADHAESMGVFRQVIEQGVPGDGLGLIEKTQAWFIARVLRYLLSRPDGITLLLEYATEETADVVEAAKVTPSLPIANTRLMERNAWLESIVAADANNLPGEFTALIGWEWSSIPAGSNLHRVLFTPEDATVAINFQPFSSSMSNYPEDLWHWLDKTSAETGADFISIPHNSNISRGYMFPAQNRLRGTPIDDEWINLRARWESVVEATQVKGDSETDPSVSPDDPFADFESFPHYLKPSAPAFDPGPGDFVRSALRTGLALEQQLGSNPYKFGLIGSTDSHTGLATAEEGNFWGKMASDSLPEDKADSSGHIDKLGWTMSASGLAAVWAEDNSRQSIFDAFRRREVYATTGPRIAVRVYAGTDISMASTSGVPMGGELVELEVAPSFLIQAAKDPKSANLDRVQMIKGWLQGEETHERVYDVVWSDDRQADAAGNIPAIPNTVDATTGHYSSAYGAATLAAVWIDPNFDPAQAAFYYVRVLEVPTPRHSTLDAIALGVDVKQTGQAVSIQERAYTSPIYYSPTEP